MVGHVEDDLLGIIRCGWAKRTAKRFTLRNNTGSLVVGPDAAKSITCDGPRRSIRYVVAATVIHHDQLGRATHNIEQFLLYSESRIVGRRLSPIRLRYACVPRASVNRHVTENRNGRSDGQKSGDRFLQLGSSREVG